MQTITQESISITSLKVGDYVEVPGRLIGRKGTFYCTVQEILSDVEEGELWHKVRFTSYPFTGWLPSTMAFKVPPKTESVIKDSRQWQIPSYGSGGKRVRGVSVD